MLMNLNKACRYSPLSKVLCKASLRVNGLSWKPHIPNEAACKRQFPSPMVASGQRTRELPFLPPHHQFSLPVASKQFKHPVSIKSLSRNCRNESEMKETNFYCLTIQSMENKTNLFLILSKYRFWMFSTILCYIVKKHSFCSLNIFFCYSNYRKWKSII